jgi:uncharacterized membrane protein
MRVRSSHYVSNDGNGTCTPTRPPPRRANSGIVVITCVAAVLVTPSAANAADRQVRGATLSTTTSCQASPLPVPPGTIFSRVTGGDHKGRNLAGEAVTSNGSETTAIALQWFDGQPSILNTAALAPYAQVNVTDVNSKGIVVGYRWTDFSSFHTDAWVYQNGAARLLPALTAGAETKATAINSRGDVVGSSDETTTSGPVTRAVIWPADQPGTVRALVPDPTVPAPAPAVAVDIDDNGTVLGFLGWRPNESQRPYVWPRHGPGFALTGPAGTSYPEATSIHGVWVAGYMSVSRGDGSGFQAAVRWDLRTRVAEVISNDHNWAYAVNSAGTVAVNGALIYANGRTLDMGGHVTVVSDRGTAAGTSSEHSGDALALVWTRC